MLESVPDSLSGNRIANESTLVTNSWLFYPIENRSSDAPFQCALTASPRIPLDGWMRGSDLLGLLRRLFGFLGAELILRPVRLKIGEADMICNKCGWLMLMIG